MENLLFPPSNRARIAFFLAIASASMVLCWRTLRALAELSLTNDRYSYLVLIPVISAGLIIWKREIVFRGMRSSSRWGLPALGAGLVVYAISAGGFLHLGNVDPDIARAFAALGIVIVWIGGFAFCFGVPSARAALFPLLFLILMVPLPASLLDRAVSALQDGSAATTGILFHLLGVPVIRHGLRFSLPGVEIEIAEECSGIRSSLSLFVTGILASYLLLRSAGNRIFFSLLTIPVAVFKNGVRIATLSWLGVYVNPGFLHGRLHQYSGLPVSFLALAILAPVIFALRRSEARITARPRGAAFIEAPAG